MDSKKLIGKIAADKDNKKLGKIIDIKLQTGKTVKVTKPYALILIEKPFRKDITVLIEAEKAMKVDAQYVWFNITKEEFEEEVKRSAEIQKFIEQQGLHFKDQSYRGPTADYTGLGKGPKERKR